MNFMGLWQWPAMAVNVDPVSGLSAKSDTAFACGFSNARIGSKLLTDHETTNSSDILSLKLRSQFLCDGLKFWPLAFFAGESFRVMLVLVSSSDFGFQPALRIWDVVSMQGTCVLDRNRLAGHFAFTVGQASGIVCCFYMRGPKRSVAKWPTPWFGDVWGSYPRLFRHLHGLHVFLADVRCCFKGFSQDAAWKTCVFRARNGDLKPLRSMVSKSQSLFFVQYATSPWNGCGSKRGVHSASICVEFLINESMMSNQSQMGSLGPIGYIKINWFTWFFPLRLAINWGNTLFQNHPVLLVDFHVFSPYPMIFPFCPVRVVSNVLLEKWLLCRYIPIFRDDYFLLSLVIPHDIQVYFMTPPNFLGPNPKKCW